MEQPAISSDLIRGHIDTIILHSLIDGDKYPQQISDFIENKSDNQYQIIQATLYSSLKRLESLGYVKSYWNDSDNGRRKFYQILPKGEDLVKDNLSSWSYSRSIIDKLMDLEPSPVEKTEYVVREVVKEVEVIKEIPVEKPIQVFTEKQAEVLPEKQTLDEGAKPIISEIKTEDNFVSYKLDESEVNFRNVLKGLIKIQDKSKDKEIEKKDAKNYEKLEPLSKTLAQESKKVAFNDTIEQENASSHKLKISGKIDFSDLISKAEKEGYKLKVSSNVPINIGKVFSNRLNLITSLIVFMIAVLEIVILTTVYGAQNGMNKTILIICCSAMFVYPIINGVIWAKNRNKTAEKISGDGMLISAIVAFNLFLITFAINLVLNVDFENLAVITYSLILPILLFFDIFAYFTLKFLLSKLKLFRVK